VAYLVPQPFINDQQDYDWFASKILAAPYFLASHSFRTYPYPLFLAVLYAFAGFANHNAVYIAQGVIDSSIIGLVYVVTKKATKNEVTAIIGAIIYAVNPFTSGYINVVLSEILSTFGVALTLLSCIWFIQKPSPARMFIVGLVASWTFETRNALLLWMAIPLGAALVFSWKHMKQHVLMLGILYIGLIIPTIYPLAANWTYYRELSPTTVDNFFVKEWYIGTFVPKYEPIGFGLPWQAQELYKEFYTEYCPTCDAAYRNSMANKYMTKTINVIWANPIQYITRMLFPKFWYVWQKEAIYVYIDPFYYSHKLWIYIGNLMLLVLSLWGSIVSIKKRSTISKWLGLVTFGTFLYASIIFSVTIAEERLTIPFYPLVIIMAGIGLGYISSGVCVFLHRIYK